MSCKMISQTTLLEESLQINGVGQDGYTTSFIDISDYQGYAIQVKITQNSGPTVGTMSLVVTNWDDVALATPEILSGSSVAITGTGSHMWNVEKGYYNRVAVRFGYTSGDFTVTIIASIKG